MVPDSLLHIQTTEMILGARYSHFQNLWTMKVSLYQLIFFALVLGYWQVVSGSRIGLVITYVCLFLDYFFPYIYVIQHIVSFSWPDFEGNCGPPLRSFYTSPEIFCTSP
jgi:hypothetical protein